MKTLQPNKISIYFALILSAFITVIVYCIDIIVENSEIKQISEFVLIFISVVVFSRFFIKRFVDDRLRLIYKIIRDVPVEEKKKLDHEQATRRGDNDLKLQVSRWAAEKQQEIKRLRELEQYRKEFVGNVSHELKTPIFNIQGYILTLLDGGLEDPNINKMYLQRTEKSIDRMISIVEDLDSIGKLEHGQVLLKKENFDLIKMVDDVFDIEHMWAKECKVQLKIQAGVKRIPVHGDKKRIMEVMSNLVINGIKYNRPGGCVKVSFHDLGGHYMIEVKDNGIGISEEHQKRVFERFYRVDKHRSREQGGTGLGLSIVKHIIEAHDQTINVKSSVGEGATFRFTIDKAVD